MSDVGSSDSESETSFNSDIDENIVEEEPVDTLHATASDSSTRETSFIVGPYSEEPIADEKWLDEYRKEKDRADKMFEEYSKRLSGETSTETWCTCGHCKIDNLVNPCECQCCQEIDGCVTALNSDLVLAEIGFPPECITSHPGFSQVCLQKWSLRLSAGKYRTMTKKSYRVLDSEERFFRSVSYREFSQLVHGYLGKRRLPLPACAYEAIRTTFPSEKTKGYVDEED